MTRELDAADLVRTLNDQADFDRFPQRPPRGGTASVSISDGIGSDDCWCGRPNGHDWVGKADHAPHPRYPE